MNMNRYVDSTEQLVVEILVRDTRKSVDFYRLLGFELIRDELDFVEMAWEGHRLFLAGLEAIYEIPPSEVPRPQSPTANIRVMVPTVDDCWQRVNEIGARIVEPIGNRTYGLRDFTIADPDGFGIRFASSLSVDGRRAGTA